MVSKSRNKIHQTWGPPISGALYKETVQLDMPLFQHMHLITKREKCGSTTKSEQSYKSRIACRFCIPQSFSSLELSEDIHSSSVCFYFFLPSFSHLLSPIGFLFKRLPPRRRGLLSVCFAPLQGYMELLELQSSSFLATSVRIH